MKKHTQSPYESSKVSYKPSGIDYLGLIPHHWEVARSGLIYKNISSGTTPQSDNDEYYKNGNIFWINSGDLNDSVLTNSKNKITQRAIMAYSVLKIFPKGSLIIAMYGATIGKVSILGIDACTNQACCVLCESKYLNTRFVFYYFIAKRQDLISMAYGGGQPNISQDIIKNFKIPLPPLQEQKEIVEFLDSKCEKIQNYIDKKQKLITLLQEKKQALINKVVTKGLNPNIEFKNSGIEYLGLIPHHWEVRRMKFMASIHNGREQTEIADENGIYPIYGSGGILGKSMYFIYDKPSVLLGRKGTIDKPLFVEEPFWTIDTMFYTSVSKIVLPKYFYYLCLTIDFQFYISGSAIPSMTQYDLANISFALPPLQEQKQIANFLDEKCEKINSVIEKTKKQIELVKEYKNTLINEAVCGRINLQKRRGYDY